MIENYDSVDVFIGVDVGKGEHHAIVTALTEIPQFCSLKFPTPGRFRS